MSEILDGSGGIKPIAFYLPQFHAIPENDRAWGKGFTEWVNVRKAQPLTDGHYQPRVPYQGRYYNLLDRETKLWQAELAKAHGVFGFCYYHYWFKNGRKLLEQPAEQMLRDPGVDMPFCFSWANENWTRKWDGKEGEIIARQDYGREADWTAHFEYLLPFFQDPRYITLNGKPVLLIYKPEEIPCLADMLACWRNMAARHGLPGLCLMIQNPNWYYQPSYSLKGFDYQVKFQPFFGMGWSAKKRVLLPAQRGVYRLCRLLRQENRFIRWTQGLRAGRQGTAGGQTVLSYDEIWRRVLSSPTGKQYVEGAVTDWDNTPRTKTGYRFEGASPEKFGAYFGQLCRRIRKSGELPAVFVNAWNEWGEGAYLEPDEKYRCAYLEALCRTLREQDG